MIRKLAERSRLGGVMGLIQWDQEVMMPSGAGESRAQQIAALAGVLHDKATDPLLGKHLSQLIQADQHVFNSFEWCNIREGKRDYDIQTKVPKELAQEIAELGSRGHQVWAKARHDNRFEDFVPVLKRFIVLKKKWAEYVFPGMAPYDANIDIYERGMTMAKITPIFQKLKAELIPLIRAIQDKGWQPEGSFLIGDFPIAKQEALGSQISRDIGFSFDHGRMDVSVHPFCGGSHPTDVRITTRYRTDNFIESLYAVIHETGHALYEQGRMEEGRDLPASDSLTMGIHESQSLFWERMIAQDLTFCDHYLEAFKTTFPESFKNISSEELYHAINISKPSFIRVEADEVTYPMHVILRYEIEKGLFDGSIEVEKLPTIWNDRMEEYLGIRPPTDAQGVLQDVHWSGGAFGYFPSYTLGAMYACQFFESMRKDFPDVRDAVRSGNFSKIKSWLNNKIHRQGRLYSADELVHKVTGSYLDPEIFIKYLKDKYGAIYKLR